MNLTSKRGIVQAPHTYDGEESVPDGFPKDIRKREAKAATKSAKLQFKQNR